MQKYLTWIIRLYGWLSLRLYHEFAWAYDFVSWMVSFGRWGSVRNVALEHLTGERILEVGFGTGELLIQMGKSGYRVFGVDRSAQMHRVTRRKLDRLGLKLPLLIAETQNLPFTSESFDSIVSTFPAGYILDADTWKELSRLLRNEISDIEQATLLPANPGRIVVVGAYVWRPGKNGDTKYPDSQSRAADMLGEQFLQLATNAGLRLTIESHQLKRWVVPVMIAEKIRRYPEGH